MAGGVTRAGLGMGSRRDSRKSRRLVEAFAPILRTLVGGATAAAMLGVVHPANAQVAPTSTWTGTGTNWSDGSAWTPVAPTSAATTVLQFNNAGSAYTSNNDIAGPFQLNGLLFNNTGTGAISLTGSPLAFVANAGVAPIINLASGTGAVNIGNDVSLGADLTVGGAGTGLLTLTGTLTGTGNLSVATGGTLQLSGDDSAWAGSLAINRGTVVFDYSASNTDKIKSTSSLTFGSASFGGGGGLTVNGNASAGTTQTVAGTIFNAGQYNFALNSGSGQNLVFNAGAITRNSGSSIALSLTGNGGGTSTLNTTVAVADTIFGNIIVGGTDFGFQAAGTTSIVALPVGNYTTQNAAGSWGTTGLNITNSAAYTGTIASGTSIASLRFNNAAASTITQGGAVTDSFVITSGGILLTSAVTGAQIINAGVTQTLTGPYLTTGNGTTDLTITNNGTGALTINTNIGLATGVVPQAVVKAGSGGVTISNASMIYSANGLFVNGGTLTTGISTTLSAVTFNNSTYALRNPLGTTAANVATPVTIGNGATLDATFGAAFNGTATFGNSIRVPQGTGTLIGRATGGTATALISLGGITLGDGAQFTLNDQSSTLMRFQFTGPIAIQGGPAGEPTSATINSIGGSFHTFTGALVGTSGGSTLNLIGTNDYTFASTAAPTNITRVTRTGGRLYVNNPALLGQTATSVPVTIASGATFIQDAIAATYLQTFTVASGGGIAARTAGPLSLQGAGLPTTGTLILNNDNGATGAVTIAGTYAPLTGPMTFQIGGTANATAANAIGATTITNGLDATNAGSGGTFVLTANYSPGTASTTSPSTTNLLNINSLSLGTNSLNVTGTGTGSNSASITIGNITTTGPGTNSITKNGQGNAVLTLTGTTSAFSGGVTVNTGALRIGANPTITGGILTGGPLGTGLLTLNSGSTVQDNGTARTVANSLAINGPVTFSSTGSTSLTFDDAGLNTPSTITIQGTTASPILTVSNTTTFSAPISLGGSVTDFHKSGLGTLIIDADYGSDTGTISVDQGVLILNAAATTSAAFTVASGATIRVEGSSLAFNNADNKVTLASGAIAIRGAGVDLNEFKAWLGTGGVSDVIVTDSSDAYDFTGSSTRRLGSIAPGFVYSGTLTPDPTSATYRIGGGGGTLYFASPLVGANALDVGLGSSVAGDVFLLNSGNSFSGGTTITGASTSGFSLIIKSDGALGSPTGGLTFAAAAVTPRLVLNGAVTTPNTRTFTISGSTSSTIDGGSNNQVLNNTWAGTGALVFTGRGSITTGSAITTAIPVTAAVGSFSSTGAPIGLTTALTGSPFGGANFVMQNNVALTTGAATSTIANTGAATFTYLNGTLSLGASGTPNTTLTLGGTGASFVRTARGALVLAPANGTANLGTASGETYKVGGTAPTVANTVVSHVFGRNNDANGTGTFLNYTASGFVPSTYTTFAAGNIDASTATTVADVTAAVASQSTNVSAYALRTNSNITINAANAVTVGAGGLVLNGSGTTITGGLPAGGLILPAEVSIYTSGSATISAIIPNTNAPAINVVGPGVLTLSGAQLFQGNINIRGGTLATIGFTDSTTTTTGTPLGGGNRTITLDGGGTYRLVSGALDLVASAKQFTLGAGGGSLDVNSGAVLTFNDANQWATAAGTGALYVTNSGTGTGTAIFSNQTYAMNGPVVIGSNTGTITFRYGANQNTLLTSTLGNGLASAFTVQTGGNLDIGTATAITRSIIFQGGSVLSSNAAGATLNGSLLVQTGGGAINNANQVTVNSEINLESGGLYLAGAGALTMNAPIVGAGTSSNLGGLTNSGTYGLFVARAFTPRTDNTYTGNTAIVTGGTVSITSDSQLSVVPSSYLANNISLNGGTLSFQGSFVLNSNRGIVLGPTSGTGTGTIDVGSGFTTSFDNVLTNQGAGVGGLTKSGLGTLILPGTNANTYTGVTTVAGGILQVSRALNGLGDNATASAITFTGGTLNFSNDGAGNNGTIIFGSASNPGGYGVSTLSGTSTLNVGNLSASTGNTVQFSSLTGAGGTLNLTNANGYNVSFLNGVSVSATSTINNNLTGVPLNLTTITNGATAATLTLGGTGATTTVSGAITQGAGALTLNKVGTGVLNLNGATTITGNLSANGGTLNLNGVVNGSATASVLSTGTVAGTSIVNVTNNFAFSSINGAQVAGSNLIYNQTAGTVTMSLATDTNTNNSLSGAGYSYFNLTGGSFSQNATRFSLNTGAGTGVAYVGGTATLNAKGTYFLIGYNANNAAASVTVAPGATIDHSGATQVIGINWTNTGTYGALNVAGGTLTTTTKGVQFGGAGAANSQIGQFNLAGGTFNTGVGILNSNTSGTGNNYYINLAGATIKTTTAVTGLFPATTTFGTVTTTVFGQINNSAATGDSSQNFNGGLVVNTNGLNSTITTAILGASASGVAQSSLAVTGGTGYVGAPLVQFTGGTLAANGTPASGYALISGGAVTGIVITSPGTYTAAPSITLTGGGGTGASVAVGSLVTNDLTGGLTKQGTGNLTLSAASTYTGPTVIQGGNLVTTNIGLGGVASGIGISSNAATNLVLDGGTLQYAGTVAAITDRNFTLTANGGGLDASGTTAGTLTFNGSMTASATTGSQTFTLSGTGTGATGAGSLNGTIVNGSGTNVTNFVKSGTGTWTLAGANTFSGSTAIQAGTLSVSSFNSVNGGTPLLASSSLGAPTTIANGTISLGSTTLGATVVYTGSGETTDRVLNFAGTTGGATLVQSGTGLLKFTSNLTATGTGNKTLTLQGSTAGAGELAGAIPDLGGATGITKTGTGIWTLSGAGTYTGQINVNGGRLVFDSNASLAQSTTNRLFVGAGGTSGAVIQKAGSVINVASTISGTDVLGLGEAANGYGYYQNSGTLTVGQFAIGGATSGTNVSGVFDQVAGSTSIVSTGGYLLTGWGGGASTNPNGVLNIYGGTVNNAVGTNDAQMGFTASSGSFGMFNLLGAGAVFNATAGGTTTQAVDLSKQTGNFAGVLNLKAGTLQANLVRSSNSGTPTYVGFSGGTLKANSANNTFITGITRTTLYAGGATIDSNAFNVTIPQDLLAPSGSGLTSIPVGAGGAGYVGPPVVRITGGGGTGATAIANVDLDPASATYGQVTGYTITSPGNDYTSAPTITLIGGGATAAATPGTAVTGLNPSGGLTKTGLGTLTLTGNNTYSGGTTISAGTLQIGVGGTAGTLGSSTVSNPVVNNAALTISRSDTFTLGANNLVSGTGVVTHAGTGTLSLTANHTYTGGTVISGGGTLQLANGTAGSATGTGPISFSGSGGFLTTSAAGGRTDSALQLNIASNTIAPGGLLAAGGITLAGGGATNVNTTFNFDFVNDGGTGAATNYDLITLVGPTLDVQSGTRISFGSGGTAPVFAPPTSGTYKLFDISGYTGTPIDVNNFNISPTPGVAYSLSTVGNFIQLSVLAQQNYTWNVAAGGTWTNGTNWTPLGGPPNANTHTATLGEAIAVGTASVTLDGDKTVAGLTFNTTTAGKIYSVDPGTVTPGWLILDNGGLASPVTIDVTGANSHFITAPVVLQNDANITIATGLRLDVSGAISNDTGTGSFTKLGAGTLGLTGTNTFGGTGATVTVAAGTLEVSTDANLGNIANSVTLGGGTLSVLGNITTSRALILTGNGTIDVSGTNSFTTSNGVTGTGGLTKANTGSLVIGGNYNTGAALTSSAGTLTLNGATNTTGVLTVSGGTTNVNGTSTTTSGVTVSGGTLSLNSATNALGPINVSGGTLNVVGVTGNTATNLTLTGGTTNLNAATGFGNVTSTGATLNFNAATNFSPSGIMVLNAGSTTNVNNGATLTLSSLSHLIGNSTGTATLNVLAGGKLAVGTGTGTFAIGPSNGTANLTSTGVVDASAATGPNAVVISVASLGFASTTNGAGGGQGTLKLPTDPASSSTITATTSVVLGSNSSGGQNGVTSTINFGGGTVLIDTPSLTIGGSKSNGSITSTTNGTLTIRNGASGKTGLAIGNNTSNATGTTTTSLLDLTSTNPINGTFGAVTMAGINSSAAGSSTATFTLNGASTSLVTLDSITTGAQSGSFTAGGSTSTLNVTSGTMQFNSGGTGIIYGAGIAAASRTSAININGANAVLNLNNQPIYTGSPANTAFTTTVALSNGVLSNVSTLGTTSASFIFNFTGGTLRNTTTIPKALAQTATTASSLLDVASGNTTITGGYSLTGSGSNSASATVAATRILSVTGPVTATGSATGPGVLTVNGSLTSATSVTLNANGVLAGSGTIAAPLTINGGGSVRPGDPTATTPTAVLAVNSANFTAGTSLLGIKLNGTGAGTNYDQLGVAVGGSATIAQATLSLKIGAIFSGNGNESFVIINNASTNALTGYFGSLAVEASGYTNATPATTLSAPDAFGKQTFIDPNNSGFQYTLSYNVDAANPSLPGNDVVLNVVPEPGMLGLAGAGAVGLLLRRRRRAR